MFRTFVTFTAFPIFCLINEANKAQVWGLIVIGANSANIIKPISLFSLKTLNATE